jgi:uncharacterized membrane protein YhdT
MEQRIHRILIWTGPGMIFVWLGAFLWIAGFVPPTRPSANAAEIVDFYSGNESAIKIGLVISMFGCALLVPWAVAVSGQLRRIDGAKGLADVQMVSCALLSLEFIAPIGMWMGVSFVYRDIPPDVVRAIHNIAWITFMTVIWSLFIQLIAIAIAILGDRRSARPVLPHWLGYLSAWVSVLIMPAGIVLFFRSGPFAWNGVIGLYTPLVAFTIWIFSMTIVIHRNLTREINAGVPQAAHPHSGVGAKAHIPTRAG